MDVDVAVIGGGSAGCAAAHVVAGAGLSVCLIEAGADYGAFDAGRWPGDLLEARRFPTSHDWGFAEERGEELLPEPRAKVLGGCSAHNQCGAVWGLPEDYNRWAQVTGDDRWRYERLRPLFNQIEDAHGRKEAWRGHGGLVPTRRPAERELASWQRAFLNASSHVGFHGIDDLGAPDGRDGSAPFHENIHRGVRWNSAFAFVDSLRGQNGFRTLDRTLADRFIIKGDRAEAVVCLSGNGRDEVRATHFVLTAGVYGSPAILMRSGVGPATHLQNLGIRVILNLPQVGSNLQDHPGIALRYPPRRDGLEAVSADLASGRLFQSQVGLRCKRGAIHVLPYQAPAEGGGWTFELLGFAMRPESRGVVRLRGTDPALSPSITFRFLSDAEDHDIAVLQEALALIQDVAATAPLATLVETGARVENAEEYIRGNVAGYAHAVGTCHMGSGDPATTVSLGTGRLVGIDNVWIGDASAMPIIPCANTNLTCMLIGWRVGEAVVQAATDARVRPPL